MKKVTQIKFACLFTVLKWSFMILFKFLKIISTDTGVVEKV